MHGRLENHFEKSSFGMFVIQNAKIITLELTVYNNVTVNVMAATKPQEYVITDANQAG